MRVFLSLGEGGRSSPDTGYLSSGRWTLDLCLFSPTNRARILPVCPEPVEEQNGPTMTGLHGHHFMQSIIPAKAPAHCSSSTSQAEDWTPAFAGVTVGQDRPLFFAAPCHVTRGQLPATPREANSLQRQMMFTMFRTMASEASERKSGFIPFLEIASATRDRGVGHPRANRDLPHFRLPPLFKTCEN